MRKEDYKGYAFAENFSKDYELYPKRYDIDPDYAVSDVSPNDTLLKLIYSMDERTKCPTGDLTFFVNEKANPEVKKFILDNLMFDVSSAAKPSLGDLPDDLILELTRKDGEDLEAYAERLNSEVKRAQWINDEYKKSLVPAPDPKERDLE